MKRLVPSLLFLLTFLSFSVSAADRLELDEAAIQGSRELPKILYIVPWKSARLGLLQEGAGSSPLNTAFEALDRDVFRRQVEYYGKLYGPNAKAVNDVGRN